MEYHAKYQVRHRFTHIVADIGGALKTGRKFRIEDRGEPIFSRVRHLDGCGAGVVDEMESHP